MKMNEEELVLSMLIALFIIIGISLGIAVAGLLIYWAGFYRVIVVSCFNYNER